MWRPTPHPPLRRRRIPSQPASQPRHEVVPLSPGLLPGEGAPSQLQHGVQPQRVLGLAKTSRPLGSHARHALETTKSVATARRPWCPQPKESSCPRASQALQARHHASPPAGGTRRQRAQDAIQRAARSHLFEPVANSGGVQFHSLSAVGILMQIYIYTHIQ